MFLQHPLTVFLFLFSLSVSQLARGCCHPRTQSWQQFTFRIADANVSMCSDMSRFLRSLHAASDFLSGRWKYNLNICLLGHLIHLLSRWDTRQSWDSAPQRSRKISAPAHPSWSGRQVWAFFSRVCREKQMCCAACWCVSSSLLCSCVPVSSAVQVGALGVVSMDTKQLAGIQNRTWRVAYLEALGVRKS